MILVAKGDLTMGGRDQGNDTLAISNFDHNDANNLKVGVLTAPNPLRGLDRLAKQVAASGITKISGDVIIDDRLFKPFRVPNGICSLPPSSSTTTASMLLCCQPNLGSAPRFSGCRRRQLSR